MDLLKPLCFPPTQVLSSWLLREAGSEDRQSRKKEKYILQRTKKVPMNEMGRAAQILRREMSIGMNPPSLHYVPAPHPVLCPLPLPWIYNLAE